MKVNIYTDGGSRNNPGPAAAGAFIQEFDTECKQYLGVATNNEAEYQAIILGLSQLKRLVGKNKTKQTSVVVYMDSQLAVEQLNRNYKLKSDKVIPLFVQVHNICVEYQSVEFVYIPREKNKKADALVNQCLDENARNRSQASL